MAKTIEYFMKVKNDEGGRWDETLDENRRFSATKIAHNNAWKSIGENYVQR